MALRNKVVFSDENNNVGIGIVATQRLHVSSGGTNDVAMLLNSTDSSWHNLGILKDGSQLNIAEYNNAGDTLSEKLVTFEFNGNKVGICTDNPQALLQVKGENTLVASTGYRKTWVGGAGTWGADSYEELGVGYSGIRSIYKAGSCWDLQFTTGNNTDFVNGTQSARMTITCAGDIGIGTDSPNYILDSTKDATSITYNLKTNVTAAANNCADIAFQLWSGAGSGANDFGGAGTSRPSVVLRAISEDTAARGAFAIATFSGGATNATLTEKMRITNDGRVGIGTDSPQLRVSTEVPLGGLDGFGIQYSNETKGELTVNPSTGEVRMGATNSTGTYFTTLYSNGSERARITSAGNFSVNDAQNTAFTNTSGTAKYIGVASNNNDALFIAHSSGQGVGYFGYDYSADRLIIATDSGAGGNSIQFSLNAGATSGGTTDNLAAATATMTICQNSKIFLEGPTQTLITSSAAREGAVINLDGNYGWEVGYVGGDYNGGILFNTSDTSGNGVGVGAAIRSMATDPYGRYSLDFHTTGNTVAEGDDALRMRIDAIGATNIYNNAAPNTASTNFRVYGYDSDSRFSLGNGGGNNDITMCMTDGAGNVKVCMYGHSGNAFFQGSIDTNTCVESPVFCAISTTIPLSITDSGVATYNWCFANDNVVSFMTNTTSTKTQYFCNAGTGSMNVCVEGCVKSPIVCGTTCLSSNFLRINCNAAGLGCGVTACFSRINDTGPDGHRLAIVVDPAANVVLYCSTGTSLGGHCFYNCAFSPYIYATCFCGTTCVKGVITCGGTCVVSPIVCGTSCVTSPIIEGTNIRATTYVCSDDTCMGADWFRNVKANSGLYNVANANHFTSTGACEWTICSSPNAVQLKLVGCKASVGCLTTGYLYGDSSSCLFGLLNCAHEWAVMVCPNKHVYLPCTICANITCGITCVTSGTICATTTMQVGGNDVLTTASSVGVGFCAGTDVNNRVVTANGASSLCGEANMTFDGSTLNVTGAITATGDITSTSDERVKCDIAAICGAIQIVNNLCGRVFIKDNREQVGVIAQEVEKVLPQVVFEHSNNDLKSVSYGNIVGVLIEAIKDQNKRIDELENIIQDMGYGSKK